MSKSVKDLMNEKSSRQKSLQFTEKAMPLFFLVCAIISILTTFGIVFTLAKETFTFFSDVPILEFLTGKEWYPFFKNDPSFGILPLLSGTFLIAGIAMLVAVPLGLASAIYLSEYATERTRKIVKPVLEVLAGVPTVVYGLFALTFVTPLLQTVYPELADIQCAKPWYCRGDHDHPADYVLIGRSDGRCAERHARGSLSFRGYPFGSGA